MQTSHNSRFPFTSFPHGWFRVAYSHELIRGGVIPLRYFGQDLVLFRTKNGIPYVLDAHCPHLGAHLGYVGVVKQESIQCPFHGWCFNGRGQCIAVPYTNELPLISGIHSWYVREINGLILVYYHALGDPPDWEIPKLSEYTSEQWTPWSHVFRWKTRASIQALSEITIADTAHFGILHPDTFHAVKSSAIKTDRQVLIHHMSPEYNHLLPIARMLGIRIAGAWEAKSYGLGYHVFRSKDNVMTKVESITLFTWTPIDEEYVDAHFLVKMKKVFNEPLTYALRRIGIAKGTKAFEEDLGILKHKVKLPNPILCENDGPIAQYRRWASQFYEDV